MRKEFLAPTLLLAGVLAYPTIASAQVDSPATEAREVRDDKSEWGLLGLLGLAGLLGLRRRGRDDVRVATRGAR